MSDEQRAWHKSSYSGGSGSCVEVAEGPLTGVRDTQHPNLGHIDFPAPEWTALLGTVRSR